MICLYPLFKIKEGFVPRFAAALGALQFSKWTLAKAEPFGHYQQATTLQPEVLIKHRDEAVLPSSNLDPDIPKELC